MTDSTSHPTDSTPRRSPEVTASVFVGAESSSQVQLVRGTRHITAHLRAVRRSGIELVGPAFFPKQCRLEISLAGSGASGRRLAGVVRKVHLVDVEPTYAVFLQLDAGDAQALSGFEVRGEALRGGATGREAVDPGLGSMPGWAALLVGQGLLAESDLRSAAASAMAQRVDLEEVLLKGGSARPETIAACMAMDQSVPYVDPRAYEINVGNGALVPEDLARRHGIFPLFVTGGVITLGMDDPTDLALIDQVRLRTNSQVDPCLCPPGRIKALLDNAYRRGGAERPSAAPASGRVEKREEELSVHAVVRRVTSIVADSARGGASDIHIEPERDFTRVRIRVDGILHETANIPRAEHAPIISRIKVMAKLDIAETRRSQDGHFRSTVDGKDVDVRVSTIPTVHGENVVMRLLMSDDELIGLGNLGMPQGVLTTLQRDLNQPNGMVLVTGPTGSGKTTTLYAALEHLNTVDRNVVTVEDPVEKRVPLLRQTQVNPKAGITFASGLRSILRQDPDVIMVGEIRDKETGEIAVQAALTGHLVLSTLHTNTAAGAVVRLSEMGVAPFLITSSLRSVLSQRLTRRICDYCAREVVPDPRLLAGLGLGDTSGGTFMAGAGCGHCLQTGYKGRIGIYEVLEITSSLGQAILGGASRDQIEQEARRAIRGGLRDDGLRKVREGQTTIDEIARVVGLRSTGDMEVGA